MGTSIQTMGGPAAGDDCIDCARKCLTQTDPILKARYTEEAFTLWEGGSISLPSVEEPYYTPSSHPGRDPKVRLVLPSEVPRRGKGGSLASRQALLHSLVHIECCAIDLAWDIIARFGNHPDYAGILPKEFFMDFFRVASDEARHFLLLLERLRETGRDYGDLPAHDGLWQSAMETADSLPARLAIEHCTHEARGLDVLPQTIGRFRNGGDAASADVLEHIIYAEEISHCAAGVRWLKYLHSHSHELKDGECMPTWVEDARQHAAVEFWFHALVRRHFSPLKPPFNEVARAQAGFGPEWYLPLVEEKTK